MSNQACGPQPDRIYAHRVAGGYRRQRVLAAILPLALNHSIQRVRQVQCINNVRQLGLALNQFVLERHIYPLYPFSHGLRFLGVRGMIRP